MNRTHRGVSCDSCQNDGFGGIRYKCLICSDYDICTECYEDKKVSMSHNQSHPVQAVLTDHDREKYFCTMQANFPQNISYTCPNCGTDGFDIGNLEKHVTGNCKKIFTVVVCPVCVVECKKSNEVSSDFSQHLQNKHLARLTNNQSLPGAEQSNPDANISGLVPMFFADDTESGDDIRDEVTRDIFNQLASNVPDEIDQNLTYESFFDEIRNLLYDDQLILNDTPILRGIRYAHRLRDRNSSYNNNQRRNAQGNIELPAGINNPNEIGNRSSKSTQTTSPKVNSKFLLYKLTNKIEFPSDAIDDRNQLRKYVHNLITELLKNDLNNISLVDSDKSLNVESQEENDDCSYKTLDTPVALSKDWDGSLDDQAVSKSDSYSGISQKSPSITSPHFHEAIIGDSNPDDADSELSQSDYL